MSLTAPCHLTSRKTRRLRRRNTQTALVTRRLRHTAKQFLAPADLVPSRKSPITNPSPRPRLPRHNIASVPTSLPKQTSNPHLPPPLPARQCHANQCSSRSPNHPDSTSKPTPTPSLARQQRQHLRATRRPHAGTKSTKSGRDAVDADKYRAGGVDGAAIQPGERDGRTGA